MNGCALSGSSPRSKGCVGWKSWRCFCGWRESAGKSRRKFQSEAACGIYLNMFVLFRDFCGQLGFLNLLRGQAETVHSRRNFRAKVVQQFREVLVVSCRSLRLAVKFQSPSRQPVSIAFQQQYSRSCCQPDIDAFTHAVQRQAVTTQWCDAAEGGACLTPVNNGVPLYAAA